MLNWADQTRFILWRGQSTEDSGGAGGPRYSVGGPFHLTNGWHTIVSLNIWIILHLAVQRKHFLSSWRNVSSLHVVLATGPWTMDHGSMDHGLVDHLSETWTSRLVDHGPNGPWTDDCLKRSYTNSKELIRKSNKILSNKSKSILTLLMLATVKIRSIQSFNKCVWPNNYFTNNEETFLQDFLENLKDMFPRCYMYSNIYRRATQQCVLPVSKGFSIPKCVYCL